MKFKTTMLGDKVAEEAARKVIDTYIDNAEVDADGCVVVDRGNLAIEIVTAILKALDIEQ